MLDTNYKLLKTIIEDNKNTEYGKKYNFSEIKTIMNTKKRFLLLPMMTMKNILKGCLMVKKIF